MTQPTLQELWDALPESEKLRFAQPGGVMCRDLADRLVPVSPIVVDPTPSPGTAAVQVLACSECGKEPINGLFFAGVCGECHVKHGGTVA